MGLLACRSKVSLCAKYPEFLSPRLHVCQALPW